MNEINDLRDWKFNLYVFLGSFRIHIDAGIVDAFASSEVISDFVSPVGTRMSFRISADIWMDVTMPITIYMAISIRIYTYISVRMQMGESMKGYVDIFIRTFMGAFI